MMEQLIENPLLNPELLPILGRVALVFIFGFILIITLNKGHIKGIWKTNVGQRYFGWLLIVPLYLLAVLGNNLVGLGLLLLLELMIIREFIKMSKLTHYQNLLFILAGLSLIIAVTISEYVFYLPILFLLVISLLAIKENDPDRSFSHAAKVYFFAIWSIFGLTHLLLLNQIDEGLNNTHSLLILLGFAVPLSDICAYTLGNLFRKINFLNTYKIASNLSPSKTYIGILGNLMGAGIGVAVMFFTLQDLFSPLQLTIIALVIGLSCAFGDLLASMLKRGYKVKDSGQAIIGHGGYIDRADSLIIATITIYYLLLFIA